MTTDTDQLGTVQCILHATDHDVAEFLGFFDQDTVFQMGNSGPVVGRDAITQWVGGYLASVTGTTHEVLKIWESDGAFAVRIDVTYRMQGGQNVTLPAMVEIRLREGVVTHYLIFIDPSPVEEASR